MLKKYRCHKVVQAAEIAKVSDLDAESGYHTLTFASEYGDGDTMPVTQEWVQKHAPVAGGYFVQYEDGYQSFSPARAFEDGYTEIKD